MNLNTTRRKTASPISSSRWLTYATAGAASALGGAASAEAGITVISVNQTFNAAAGSSTGAAFPVGGNASIGFSHIRTSSGNGFALAAVFGGAFRGFTAANNFVYPARLVFGAAIAGGAFAADGATGTLAFTTGFANSQWKTAGQGYFGFRFTDAVGTEYGWASLNLSGVPNNVITLNSYAYSTAGEQITAGQTMVAAVPEPGSLALLAFGGAGLLAWRQRRAKSVAAVAC